MKAKNIVKSVVNRTVFNRAYKEYLVRKSRIRCAWCKYHDNENYEGNYYGGFSFIKYPNWKLISKNRKQWMAKKIKFVDKYDYKKIVW